MTANIRAGALLGLALALLPIAAAAPAQQIPTQQMPTVSAPSRTQGPENAQLAQRVGRWDVVETVWASPHAAPVSTHAVAERRIIGAFLQEIIRPASGSPEVLRLDYLSFHPLEGRWKYVSMDTRAPVGLMSAASFGRGDLNRIDLTFEPFAVPGKNGVGQLLQMRQLIIRQDASHDRKDQYFIPADGSGKPWLAHRYAYVRRGSV